MARDVTQFIREEDEEQRRLNEEARAAAQEALTNLQGLSVPSAEPEGMTLSQEEVEAAEPDAGEPPDSRAETAEFTPTTRQINRQRDQALFNPEANRRAAQRVGDAWRAGQSLSNPPRGELAPGARADSPFRVYPLGQMPPRTQAHFPEQSEWSVSDLEASAPPGAEGASPQTQRPTQEAFSPSQPASARGLGSPMEEFEEVEPIDRRTEMMNAIKASRAAQPQEARPDYTGVDTADAFRRVLHILGSAMRGAAGQSPIPFRSMGEEARARDAQQTLLDQRTAQQKSAQQVANERLGLERERLDAQVGDMEARRGLDRDRIDLSREMQQERVGISDRRADIAMEMSRAQLRRIQNTEERESAMDDPSSQPSRSAQNALRLALRGYPPAAQERFEAANGSIDGLSQRAIEEQFTPQALSSMFRDLTSRSARRGTGQGGGNAQARAALEAPPEGWRGTPEQWAALSPRQRQSAVQTLGTRAPPRPRAGEDAEAGTEIVPGVRSPLELPRGEPERIRRGIVQAASQSANLRGLSSIHESFGGISARISPQARARIAPRLTTARGMVAVLGNTGVINSTEVPTINAALPNPEDLEQMTFGTFNARMQEWQSQLDDNIRAELSVRGVDDAGINRVLATIHTNSWSRGGGRAEGARAQAQQTAPAGDRVNIRGPNGEVRSIPRATWEANRAERERAGFSEVR